MEVDALEANFPQLKMRTVYYNSSQVLLISTEQFVEFFLERFKLFIQFQIQTTQY